ncbi:MAG: GNAT family N-acyltransferase [Marinicella sp.]|nr:lysophospholipid acyltransferase family protein [Xanthomonadales bacterium]
MIDIQNSIKSHYPKIAGKLDKYQRLFKLLEKILHTEEINGFIAKNQHLKNFNFLDAILKEFEFGYKISNKHSAKIPAEGRLIIIANHPIGSLDGLALLRMVYDIRPDVKIIATPLLSSIAPLKDLFLPIDNITKQACHKDNIKKINEVLQQEQAVIIFPAGEVSRITPKGIRDSQWKTGFIKLAARNQAPILPVYIHSRNSALFYATSMVYKPLSTLMLIHEMYKQKQNTVEFIAGDLIEPVNWQCLDLKRKALARQFKKHVFGLPKGKSQFKTTSSIAHPVQTRRLHAEIKKLKAIGETQDGMRIFLMDYEPDSLLIREIGRLRELSFRMVKEGTGARVDLDSYDQYYKHLLLWNDKELEVVGAYRLGFCGEITDKKGIKGLYTASLYDIDLSFLNQAEQTMELGRSFVQPKYWGLRGLEYLWYGIGAVLRLHPEIKYLFGAVSIPGNYPSDILSLMVAHYAHFYPKPVSAPLMTPKNVFDQSHGVIQSEEKQALKALLVLMKAAGVKLPVLFKQYTDLCEAGGVGFINFATDPDFNGCVDGLIWVEMDKMKAKKKAKYIEESSGRLNHSA